MKEAWTGYPSYLLSAGSSPSARCRRTTLRNLMSTDLGCGPRRMVSGSPGGWGEASGGGAVQASAGGPAWGAGVAEAEAGVAEVGVAARCRLEPPGRQRPAG